MEVLTNLLGVALEVVGWSVVAGLVLIGGCVVYLVGSLWLAALRGENPFR